MEELRKITAEELKNILADHEKWLKSRREEGKRADLSKADLRHSDLTFANLRGACLMGSDLRGMDLRDIDLSEADLRGADLSNAHLMYTDFRLADLKCATLREADVQMADLHTANLQGADLRDADLREANLKNVNFIDANLRGASLMGADLSKAVLESADLEGANYFIPSVCPEEGAFIAWKKAITRDCHKHKVSIIVKLLIPEDALRSSGTSRKCRASKAIVLDIQSVEGKSLKGVTAYSQYDSRFIYETGMTINPDSFDTNQFNECSHGVHFFMSREEAVHFLV